MKYNIHVNQPQAIELGIKNVNQAHIFDLLSTCAVWAETRIVENQVFYFVARQKICSELPLLNLKPDTVYRHLKDLEKIGLIVYIKVNKLDCIQITKKGKKYLSYTMSEINPSTMSEINPKKLGNKSENNSEINPTYNTTIHYPLTIYILQEIFPNQIPEKILPKHIIEFYYKNISSLQEKLKEIKSVNAMSMIHHPDNLEILLLGLYNYSKSLPVEEKYIKSLLNFIQDRTYRDYQEAKKVEPLKTNNPTNDLIREMFETNPNTDEEIIEARIQS